MTPCYKTPASTKDAGGLMKKDCEIRKLLLTICVVALGAAAYVPMAMAGRDSGGGNLLNGKPVDSYVFPYQKTDEYKNYVQSFVLTVKKYLPHLNQDLDFVLTHKTWYLVPVELETIPSSVIGTPFETTQGAIQELTSVWINESRYNSMTSELAKATLLAHEILLGLRFHQLNRSYAHCAALGVGATPENCGHLFRASLSQKDYDQVRNASHALIESANISAGSLAQLLVDNGFEVKDNGYGAINPIVFASMTFDQFKQYLAFLSEQGRLPRNGGFLWGKTDRALFDSSIAIKVQSNLEGFSISFATQDRQVNEKLSGFTTFEVTDHTRASNEITFYISDKSRDPKVNDIAKTIAFTFRGNELSEITLFWVVYAFDPSQDKFDWISSNIDSKHKPALAAEVSKN
jgi:hypothetical protein